MVWRIAIPACLAVLLLADGASALEATAETDLFLRVGPGADDRVVDVVPEGERVLVHGCVEATGQCLVRGEGGRRGWVFGAALGEEGVARPLEGEPAFAAPPPVIVVVEEGDPGFVVDEGIGIGFAPVVRSNRRCRHRGCRPHHARHWRVGHHRRGHGRRRR